MRGWCGGHRRSHSIGKPKSIRVAAVKGKLVESRSLLRAAEGMQTVGDADRKERQSASEGRRGKRQETKSPA
ncbi:hypothetical protein BN2476_200030 [Paraburkholderia piptadeniae]|uniref:Uncharacterized protein n=1 Tax=Paraburkholderia piptadeniae TaxID=1701573 RepID=A0A1N7RUY1_9BURK|nr:hypothetical protein BN2476_200030 [Paraburkholderia piptadeniae]